MTSVKIWCVYMVRCADNSLYTGISNQVSQRVAAHNAGRGAKYTRARLPVTLVYQIPCSNKREACQLEYQMKQLTKQQKEHLMTASH